jgi:CHAD domain-containing protein
MAFRLTNTESLTDGIPRVLREELSAAIRNLKTGNAGVHEARKSIKKLRGVLRMLLPRYGSMAAHEIETLGEISRSLAAARDHAAMVEIIDVLAERHSGAGETRSLAALRKRMAKRDAAPQGAIEPAIENLTQVRARVAEWPAMPDQFTPVMEGLRESYRKGRKALAAVQAEPDPHSEAFHTLRKRVKDHWYQVRLFEGLWAAAPREPQLKELQEALGDAQNLSVLEQNATLVPTVQRMVDSTRTALRARSLELATDIYAEKPKEHELRVRSLWDAWRRSANVVRKSTGRAQGHRRYKAA